LDNLFAAGVSIRSLLPFSSINLKESADMKTRKQILVWQIASILLASGAQAAEFRTAQNPIDGEYIVVLKEQPLSFSGNGALRAPAKIADVALQMSAQHRFDVRETYDALVRGYSVRADDAALAKLLVDPRVAYVEENIVYAQQATQSNPVNWGLDRIDQRALPLNQKYVYNGDGYRTNVYVVDTGVQWTHQEFLAPDGATRRIGVGYTAYPDDGLGVKGCNNHGSSVAGIIAGRTYGVAKRATIYPIRVFKKTVISGAMQCSNATSSSILAGLDFIAKNYKIPAVVNMSVGRDVGTTDYNSVDKSVAALIAKGVTVVVAAGNGSGSDACLNSPAHVTTAITVGATGRGDRRWDGSNIGSCLDIFAPGELITSAGTSSDTAVSTFAGTSQAAPHVAGAAAIFLTYRPNYTPQQVRDALVNAATTGRVIDPGTNSPNRLLYTGNL
jgi:serine protease